MNKLTQKDKAKAFDEICEMFCIGKNARSPTVLKVNVSNSIDHAEKLHAIENEYFMVPGSIEDEEVGIIPDDVCLLNCYGDNLEQYIKNFGDACNKVYYDKKDDDNKKLTEIAAEHATYRDKYYEILTFVKGDLDLFGRVMGSTKRVIEAALDEAEKEGLKRMEDML